MNVFYKFIGWEKYHRFHSITVGAVCSSSAKIRNSFCTQVTGKKTYLHDFHIEKKGQMVNFAGFQMPVKYGGHDIYASHIHTRQHVSIFDVSHMLQTTISGEDRIKFMESLTVADLQGMKNNQATLTLYTNEHGGIIDDLIVTKTDCGYLYVVSNAGCIEKDMAHVKSALQSFRKKGGDVHLETLSDRVLLAVQGPGMAKVLQPLIADDLNNLTFMMSTVTSVCGIPGCRVTRCGYTGEDGVEISIPCQNARIIIETLLASKDGDVRLAGLGARDTLRLEAGLCLYGNDITDATTPIEAGLTWTIGKKRREAGDFPGADIILKQLKNKAAQKRVGFVSSGPPARAHTPILNLHGTTVGEISSGCPSPCLKKNIAMGYVTAGSAKVGTKVKFEIRKKLIEADVVKMPFVPTKYYMG